METLQLLSKYPSLPKQTSYPNTISFVWDAVDYSDGSSDPTSLDEEEVRNRWDNLQIRMVSSCSRIWEAVKEVLCNDSPEGHLPADLDEDDAFDTKDVLSYSFRAVHESRYVQTRSALFTPYFCSRSEVTSCAHSSTNKKFTFKTPHPHQHSAFKSYLQTLAT